MLAMSHWGYESGHAEEDLLYLRSAVRPPSCFSFLSPLPLRLFEKHYRDGYKYTELVSDSCLPSHALLLHLFPQSRSLALSLLSVLDSIGSSISCY